MFLVLGQPHLLKEQTLASLEEIPQLWQHQALPWLLSLFFPKSLCCPGLFATFSCCSPALLTKATESGLPPREQGKDISPVQAAGIQNRSMPPGLSIDLGYHHHHKARFPICILLAYFFSPFLPAAKEMPTVATSKQTPNQSSFLGTIQQVCLLCPALLHFANLHVLAQNSGTVFSIFGNRGHAFPMKLAHLRCPNPPLPASEAGLTAASQRTALLGGGSLPRCAPIPPRLAGLELPGCQR